MIVLFSSDDIETLVKEIIYRQDWESEWTDENKKAVSLEEICDKYNMPDPRNCDQLDWIKVGMKLFADELKRRFPIEGTEKDYFSDETPRLS